MVDKLTIIAATVLILFLIFGDTMPKTLLDKIAYAIMDFEGYYQGSVSYQNNNPGNLKYHGQAGASGSDVQGHAIFQSFQAGWNALILQIRRMLDGSSTLYPPSFTLRQAMNRYAEANGDAYAEFIAAAIGVSSDATLLQLNQMI